MHKIHKYKMIHYIRYIPTSILITKPLPKQIDKKPTKSLS